MRLSTGISTGPSVTSPDSQKDLLKGKCHGSRGPYGLGTTFSRYLQGIFSVTRRAMDSCSLPDSSHWDGLQQRGLQGMLTCEVHLKRPYDSLQGLHSVTFLPRLSQIKIWSLW